MSILYAVTDSAGNILRHGGCSRAVLQAQAQEGELAFEIAERVDQARDMVDPSTGSVLKGVKTPAELTNKQKLRKEMPSVQEQLDALWSGPTAVAEMQAKIDAVKAKYPLE